MQTNLDQPEHGASSPNAPASSRTETRDLVYLSLLVVAASVIRLWFIQFYKVISADGVAYATLAREISSGNFATAFSSAHPPFYPMMIAVVHLFIADIQLAGQVAASLIGGLVLIPLYFLALRLGDRRTAIIACLLVTVWPSIRSLSCEVMSQSTYMLLILTAYLSYYRLLLNPTIKCAGLTSLIFALAYLTRPEAFISFALLSVYLLVYHGVITKRDLAGTVLQTVISWLIFIAIVFPYIYLIRQSTGEWQLSAKSAPVIGAALQEYLGRPDLYNEIGYKGFSLWSVVRTYPDFVLANSIKNLQFLYQDLPLYIWVPALLGCAVFIMNRGKRLERLWLLVSFAPLVLITIFYILGSGYSQFYYPLLFIWFAIGIVWIETKVTGFLRAQFPSLRTIFKVSFSVTLVLVLALYLLRSQIPDASARNRPYTPDQDGGRYDHKLTGLRLLKILPKDARIMTRSGRISFYSDKPWVIYPQASLEEILSVARKAGVRFLVVDGSLVNVRPQLGILLQPLLEPPESVELLYKETGREILPGIRMYYLYKDPSSQGVAVYELF